MRLSEFWKPGDSIVRERIVLAFSLNVRLFLCAYMMFYANVLADPVLSGS